jgi:colanic acid/amylovoran biosynthesis glycosyltransferase
MAIAYLVNQYPKVSHSFIRREIAGVEAAGISVIRFSIRSGADGIVDEGDRQELAQTHVLLNAGGLGLCLASLKTAVKSPSRLLQALRLMFKVGRRSHRGLLRHFVYLAEACLLLQECTRKDIHHIHAHFGTNSCTVAMFCQALGGPSYSVTIHGPEEFDRPEALSLTEKIHRADFVVAVSDFGKSQLCRWCEPAHWNKIHVVHCGVDAQFLDQQVAPPPEASRLVSVGRLCEQKGYLILIEAAAQLAREGLEFELTLVGDGPLRSQIEARIAASGLAERVRITGWANGDEVRHQILASRAMVLPSFAEGLPVVLMESLALGRPVISSYIAGIPELVTPECGWLVAASSVSSLANAMRTALQVPTEQLQQMGMVGVKRVATRHHADKEARKLFTLLQYYSSQEKSQEHPPVDALMTTNSSVLTSPAQHVSSSSHS